MLCIPILQAEVRKRYLRLAVQLHPDKNPDDATAKERFQALNSVYAVLGDAERQVAWDMYMQGGNCVRIRVFNAGYWPFEIVININCVGCPRPDRRKLYDETGIAHDLEHPASSSSFDDLYEYYRSMYAKVRRGAGLCAAGWFESACACMVSYSGFHLLTPTLLNPCTGDR